MPALSNINTVAQPLTNVSTKCFGGVLIRPDPLNANYVTVGIGNAVTAALQNLLCFASDSTTGFAVLANTSAPLLISPSQFAAAGVNTDAANVYCISLASAGQRVEWTVL